MGPGTTPLVFFWYLLIGYGFSSVAYALQFTLTKDIPTLPQKFWSEFVVAVGVIGVVSLVRRVFFFLPWSQTVFRRGGAVAELSKALL